MNTLIVSAVVRVLLGAFGGYLAKAGIDNSAVLSAVGSSDIGTTVVGLVTAVVGGLWAAQSHTVGALVDKAVTATGGAASPIAPVATAAKATAGVKTHLSPNG